MIVWYENVMLLDLAEVCLNEVSYRQKNLAD